MTTVNGDWELRGKESEDGHPNSGGAPGVGEISGGGKKLLTDGDFFSSETFALSGKPIVLSHIVSKTIDVSLQSRVVEVSNGSIDKASTGVSGGEDLQGVVPKKPWFSEIRGGVGIGVEVMEINSRDWSLTTFDLWIE
jgi:hypothetical protein